MSGTGRSFIIGVDGATLDVMGPLLERGVLPNFARFVKGGVHGLLRSTFPPLSPPAWISSITGCQPARHGIYHFYRHRSDPSEQRDIELLTLKSLCVPTMWEWLSAHQRTGLCVNVPLTYPPQELDGVVMVSGFGTPPRAKDICWPPGALEDVLPGGERYRADEPAVRDFSAESFRTTGLASHLASEEAKMRATIALMERHPWDVGMFSFTATDRMQHFFWHDSELLERLYREIDALVGVLLEAIPPDTTIFVMSDHGFGEYQGDFLTSAFLHDKGWLVPQTTNPLRSYRMRVVRPTVERVLMRLGMTRLADRLPPGLRGFQLAVPFPRWREWDLVDWSKTRAYCANFGVYVNLAGREARGIVQPGEEYESVREQIIEDLRSLEDPEGSGPLITHIHRREEIHHGPRAVDAPDILFMVKDMAFVQSDKLSLGEMLRPTRFSGTHRLDGVFMAAGPGIRKGEELVGASIVDVMPTVLRSAGLSIPEGLDGRVLDECFEAEWFEGRPARYEPPLGGEEAGGGDTYDDSEQADIEKRLRELGYM
jgi:predicted AlkP superfamily phosphohydrolase/phosphomutase